MSLPLKIINLASLLLILFFILVDENQRWILFNSKQASEYAEKVLNDNNTKNNSDFIDYVIVKENDYVLFSKPPNHEYIYGYFPNKNADIFKTDKQEFKWKHLSGKWYVVKLNNI